jgi:4-amino-4-deoxy-L-arabinose transferase-like glycosyltransferase
MGSHRPVIDRPLAAILVLAAVVRFWGIWFGLPNTLARPDELFVITPAIEAFEGKWAPNFFDYPRLLMYLLTALYGVFYLVGRAAGWFHSPEHFASVWRSEWWEPSFFIGRAVSAMAGTLTVWLLYRLARQWFGRETALVSALLLALAFLHVRSSHYATTDAVMTMLMVWALAALLEAHDRPRASAFVKAGVLGGLAAATKYSAVMLAIPFTLRGIIRVLDARGARLHAALRSGVPTMGIAMAATFLALSSYVIWDHHRFMWGMHYLRDSFQRGMGGGTPDIHPLIYHLTVSLWYGLGPPLLLSGLAGSLVLALRNWRLLILLDAFPVAYYLVAGDSRLVFVRYMVPIVPFLCLGAAIFVVAAADRLATKSAWRGRSLSRRWVVVALTAVVAAPSAWSVAKYDRLMARKDSRVIVADWIRANVPPGSSLWQSGSHYGHAQPERGLRRYVHWGYNREHGRFRVEGGWAAGLPDFIIVQESALPYSHVPPAVETLLRQSYELVLVERAADPQHPDNVYDKQDAFYLPYAGFRRIVRPGPNLHVWKRRHAS